MKKRSRLCFCILAALLLASAVFALSVGSANLGIGKSIRILLTQLPGLDRVIDGSDITAMQRYILIQVRLPRVLLSVLVGAQLSAVGAVFQGLFRNPLADPHILGVSSGAALGATAAILTGISLGFAGVGAVTVLAFCGAIVTIILVYLASGGGKRQSMLTVLLTGTAVSTLLSAVISLVMSLDHNDAEKVYLWTMGSFSAAGWPKAAWVAGIGAAGTAVLAGCARDLNLLAMGEDTAQSLGVETRRVKVLLLVFSSLIVAAAVSASGMISFVGLVVPHCMRFLFGGDHRRLIPASLLGGGIFLLLCDTIARTLLAPGELPVGVVTSVVGAPYFIYLIKKNSRTS